MNFFIIALLYNVHFTALATIYLAALVMEQGEEILEGPGTVINDSDGEGEYDSDEEDRLSVAFFSR
tara:strand:+ start:388 stop:585 length:198 start_codon:yes stop_codon:yes gene_type:complete